MPSGARRPGGPEGLSGLTGESPDPERPGRAAGGGLLIGIFVALSAAILAGGAFYWRSYEAWFRSEVETQLAAVADLKVASLVAYRRERLGDGELLGGNPAIHSLVAGFLGPRGDVASRQILLAWMERLRTVYAYDRVSLVGPEGGRLLSVPPTEAALSGAVAERLPAILESREAALVDFFRDEQDGKVHLAVAVPIVGPAESSAAGVIVLRIDPERYLYPSIQRWPTPSRTAEALLVRREGSEVVFLNELRFQKGTALALRLPLTRTAMPAVRGALGKSEFVAGPDYRGVQVFSAVRQVPGAPWALVARIDAEEALAPARERLRLVALLVGVLLVAAGGGVAAAWRLQGSRLDRAKALAAEALRESGERFRQLIQRAPLPLCFVQGNGAISIRNDRFLAIFGYGAEEVPTLEDWWMRAYPDDGYRRRVVETWEGAVRKAIRDGSDIEPMEYDVTCRDGTVRQVVVSGTAIGDGTLVTLRDVTDQRRAENEAARQLETLRRSEERFRELHEKMMDAFVRVDMDGRIVDWNPSYRDMVGYRDDEISGLTYVDLTPERWHDMETRIVNDQVLPRGYSDIYLKEYRRKDRSLIEVELRTILSRDAAGRPVGMWAIIRDITERRRAEEAIHESELKYRILFESMAEGVALHEIVPGEDGKAVDYRILEINPAYERHTGLSLERAKGVLASELYGGGEPPYLAEYDRVATTGEPYFFETYFPPLERHFSISVVRQKPGRFATVFEDVTARKVQEQELKAKNVELERFTYLVSHDLKSPLVTVKTFLGYLEEDLAARDPARIEKDFFYLRAATDKMGRLLEDLLELSRVGRFAHPPAEVRLGDLIAEAAHAVAGRISERGVEVQPLRGEVVLSGDRIRLGQIWQNLLENAVKYMGEQGSPRVELGALGTGRESVFFVRDNGIGIDPRFQGKVFGLFEKLDPATEGTGLGLALVKRIVELHGGRIWLESEGTGRGTTVLFTLPDAMPDREEGVRR